MTDLDLYLKMIEPLKIDYQVAVRKLQNEHTEVRVQRGLCYSQHIFDENGKLRDVSGEDLWPSA